MLLQKCPDDLEGVHLTVTEENAERDRGVLVEEVMDRRKHGPNHIVQGLLSAHGRHPTRRWGVVSTTVVEKDSGYGQRGYRRPSPRVSGWRPVPKGLVGPSLVWLSITHLQVGKLGIE